MEKFFFVWRGGGGGGGGGGGILSQQQYSDCKLPDEYIQFYAVLLPDFDHLQYAIKGGKEGLAMRLTNHLGT